MKGFLETSRCQNTFSSTNQKRALVPCQWYKSNMRVVPGSTAFYILVVLTSTGKKR